MNFYLLGYLIVLLSSLGEENGRVGVYAAIDRRGKFYSPNEENFIQKDYSDYSSTKAPEPAFVGDIAGIKVKAGNDAVLRCVVENLGDLKVMWKGVTSKTLLSMGENVFVRSNRIKVTSSNSTSWFLHIRNVSQDDIGYYACQINTHPVKSQAGHLEVVEPPEFVTNMTNRNVTVMENSNVSVSCKATGNPPPVIKWKREDELPFMVGHNKTTEYINGELRFIGVTREHMGAYLCVANNEVPPAISRRIYLDVYFPPLIIIQNQLIGARENIDVTLECQTEGHPLTENYWLRNGQPAADMTSRYQTHLVRNFYKSHMRLTIRDLKPEDYASYQCVAKNYLRETQGTIKLFRHIQPTPLPPKPVTEWKNVYPTRRVITVTTDRKILLTDIEKLENINSPGNQQKYGDGRVVTDEDSTAARACNKNSNYVTFLYTIYLLWMHILKKYR